MTNEVNLKLSVDAIQKTLLQTLISRIRDKQHDLNVPLYGNPGDDFYKYVDDQFTLFRKELFDLHNIWIIFHIHIKSALRDEEERLKNEETQCQI